MKNTNKNNKFIEKAMALHGNTFNYDLVEYTRTIDKIKIICPKHGVFEQTPKKHLFGQGCMKCANPFKGLNSPRKTTEEFIEESKRVHADKYDYSLVEYAHSHIKVRIICPEHGEFEQTATNHLRGFTSCKACSSEKRRLSHTREIV